MISMQLQTVWLFSYTYDITFITYVLLTYLLTHSMEYNPSWETNRFLSSQEIPRIE
jgi:hypothetical protein